MGAISFITRGIISPSQTITSVKKCIIPLNLRLTTDKFKLNLRKINPIKLNLSIPKTKINLVNSSKRKLSLRVIDKFKLNLKKCEE